MSRIIGIVVVLAGAALLAGCSGDGGSATLTKAEYQKQVTAAAKELATSFAEIGNEAKSVQSDAPAGNPEELFGRLADVVAKGEDNLRSVADDLDELSPPDEANEANDKLVAGLDALADDFGDLASALDDGSVADVVALGRNLQNITSSKGGKLIQEAIQTLQQAGYSFSDVG